MEEKQAQAATTAANTRTADQVQHIIEKRTLELARAKVMRELAASQNPRYSQMLQQSLTELNRKIAAIE